MNLPIPDESQTPSDEQTRRSSHCYDAQDWQAWMLGAVLASGGQICVSREDMQQVGSRRLLTHTNGYGDTFFTAVSDDMRCQDCDGLGGIAIAGSDKSHPALICQRCRGTGWAL